MADTESINDRVFNINRILQMYFFLNYKPSPEILIDKGEEYIKRIEDCLIRGEFNTLTIYALQQLKPFLEKNQQMDKTSSFLVVDSLNLFYEYYFGYDRVSSEQKTKKLKELEELFNRFYPNIRIIFVCQEHNEFFKDLSFLNRDKFIYLEVNDAIPSQTEIDDLLLMYLYFYLNVIQNVKCYLLSFDKYKWLKGYTQTEAEDLFFPEQPKIYKELQKEINFYYINRGNTIDSIMQKHKDFIRNQPITKEGRQLTRMSMPINISKRTSLEDLELSSSRPEKKMKASGKKTVKKTAKKTVKKAVKKTAKKAVKKAVKKTVKKTVKKQKK